MNAEQLLQHFERISEAPDAIPRLRRFILDLAVRGKLVEQDPIEELAEEQLERIISAKVALGRKQRLGKKRKIAGTLESLVDALPPGWASANLADLVTILNGRAYKQSELLDSGTPVLRVGNLFTSNEWYYSNLELEEDKYCNSGDLIYAWSASFGPFVWDGGRVIYHYHIWKLPLHSPADQSRDFLYLYLLNKTEKIKDAGHGISMVHMTKEKMELLEVPLPPLAEQHRIVARVEELMGLCDQLEAAKTEREQCRDILVAASLQGLTQPDEEEETFREHALFTLNILPLITTRTNHIKQLRQTILDLAVRGKLVEQDPSDEPAAELLKRIAAEKVQLVKSGKSKKEKLLPKPDLELAPFELPAGWAWGRFPELGKFGRGKSKHRPRNDPALFEGGSHLMIQTGDVARSNGVIKTYTNKYNDFGLSQSLKWPKGALCITIAANIADSGILSFGACFPDSVVGFVPASMFENARYFEYFVRTAKANLLEYAPATAQKNINLEILSQVLIPLPPLAEQNRIVAKVDELMAVCDQLEAQITQTQQDSRRFLEAVLQEALSPATAEVS